VAWWTRYVLAIARQLSPAFEPVDGLPLLMVVGLRTAPELGAVLDGGYAPLVGTPQDACALSLGQAGQQRQDAST
jgi:hypothetical protein